MKPLIEQNEETAITLFNAALTHEKSDVVILADVSSSMDQHLNGESRLTVMKRCLLQAVSKLNSAAVFLFGHTVQKLDSWEQFDVLRWQAGGDTNLAKALRRAATLNPSHIIVITDGEANNTAEAKEQALRMLSKIDVYYCGPGEARAVEFCKNLAQFGGQAVIDPSCLTMLESVTLFLTDAAIAA